MPSSLHFSNYDFEKHGYQPVPPPSLNGGLYTGQPFLEDAPWAHVHVDPDATEYIHRNLLRGNRPPPNARYQYPATRPGNSFVHWQGLKRYEGTPTNWGPHHIYVPPCEKETPRACYCEDLCPNAQTKMCNVSNCIKKRKNDKPYFSKLYYIA